MTTVTKYFAFSVHHTISVSPCHLIQCKWMDCNCRHCPFQMPKIKCIQSHMEDKPNKKKISCSCVMHRPSVEIGEECASTTILNRFPRDLFSPVIVCNLISSWQKLPVLATNLCQIGSSLPCIAGNGGIIINE